MINGNITKNTKLAETNLIEALSKLISKKDEPKKSLLTSIFDKLNRDADGDPLVFNHPFDEKPKFSKQNNI